MMHRHRQMISQWYGMGTQEYKKLSVQTADTNKNYCMTAGSSPSG